jgi:hypothetical protein
MTAHTASVIGYAISGLGTLALVFSLGFADWLCWSVYGLRVSVGFTVLVASAEVCEITARYI